MQGPDRVGVATDVTPEHDYRQLYAAHWRPLIRLAQSLVDDAATAEDVVQEAFAGLFRRRTALRAPSAAAAYLRTSVVNGARSTLRRRRASRRSLHLVDDEVSAPGADEAVLLSAEHLAARKALAQLPRRQREVLGLRFLCDLSDREIAAATGMSHANVRSAASRGLAALRAAMGETDDRP